MSQAPVMPVFTDALIGDTTHLSAEEFGAYFMILLVTWRNNGEPLQDDNERIARIARIAPRRWSRVRKTLEPFFDLSAGTWRQKRLEKEWNRTQISIVSKREKGKRGAEARWLKTNDTKMAHANGTGNSKGNGTRYGNHNHNQEEPPNPLERGNGRNGRNTDPFHLAGLSSEALMHRFNAAAYGSAEREAIRRAMEQPP